MIANLLNSAAFNIIYRTLDRDLFNTGFSPLALSLLMEKVSEIPSNDFIPSDDDVSPVHWNSPSATGGCFLSKDGVGLFYADFWTATGQVADRNPNDVITSPNLLRSLSEGVDDVDLEFRKLSNNFLRQDLHLNS